MNTRGLFSLKPPRCIYSMFSEDMALVKFFFFYNRIFLFILQNIDFCSNFFSHFSLNHVAIGTLSTSRSSTVFPSLSSLPTCKRAFSTANERMYSSECSFPVTTSTLPCRSSSVCLSDNPTERQSLSIRKNSASMGNHSFALSMMRLRLPISR